jgi:hypothetical protein
MTALRRFDSVSLVALKWRVAAAIVLAFAILPVAFGEDGAPEQKLAERLSADTAAGVLSRDEAAIYAFLALFVRRQSVSDSTRPLLRDGGFYPVSTDG